MKKLIFILIIISIIGCDQLKEKSSETREKQTEKKEGLMKVSFLAVNKNKDLGLLVAYTNDIDSLWLDDEWNKSIHHQMKELSKSFSTILLFDSEEHTPNVKDEGMSFAQSYDKYMVCGFWVYPNGGNKYCYGGIKKDGNFKICKEY